MNYNKPLVSKLDTTTEVAGCQPCLEVAGIGITFRPRPVQVGDTTVGSPCPQTPLPGTPQIDGVDTGGIGDSILPGTVVGDVGGNDFSVSL